MPLIETRQASLGVQVEPVLCDQWIRRAETRVVDGFRKRVLNALAQNIPWLIGGSADLATSNKTTLKFEGTDVFRAGN